MTAVSKDVLPRLLPGENLGAGLRRVVRCCVEVAGNDGARAPDAAIVHQARRALKRARAVLRLGELLGQPQMRVRRRRLAALARKLSPLRDATVVAHQAQKLETKAGAEIGPALAELQRSKSSAAGVAWWAAWQRRLAAEIRALDQLPWASPTTTQLKRALARSARRVCRRAQKAHRSREVATTHEWRKAVIALREQLAVVEPLLDRKTAALHPRLHVLSDKLGRVTDLHVLLDTMAHHAWPADLREACGELRSFLQEKQRHAMERARKHWPTLKRELRAAFD